MVQRGHKTTSKEWKYIENTKKVRIELPCSSWELRALFSNPPQLQPQQTWRNVSKHHHLTWNMKNLKELTHKYQHIDLKSQVSGFQCFSESTESPKVHKWENPCCCKVSGCYSVIILHQTPIFDWCVVRWGSKNKCYKDTCLEEIKLCLQTLLTTPHSKVNTTGRALCIQLRNQQTCTSNYITESIEVRFSIQLMLMLHRRFANATQVLLP